MSLRDIVCWFSDCGILVGRDRSSQPVCCGHMRDRRRSGGVFFGVRGSVCLCARVCVCAYDPIFDLNTLDKLLLAFMRIDSFFFCMGEGSNISILHVAPRRVDVIIALLFYKV